MDGQCFDPVVRNAIRRVLKRFPSAKGNEGECNRNYWGITLDMSTQDGEDQVRARVAADPSLIDGDATTAAPSNASADSPRADGAPSDAEIKQAIQTEFGQVYLGQAGSNRVQCDPDGPIQVSDPIGVLGPSNDANTYDGFAVNLSVTCKLYTSGDPIPHLRHRGAANSEIFLFYRDALDRWRFTTRYYPGGY
jgi:hypothetical protein